MLNAVIRFALRQRLLIVAFALFLVGYGGWQIAQMPIDVFPNLNRPRVTVITEAPGMAPEEVEALITFPLETVLNGANNVVAVRSSSGVSISVIYVEFDWGTDIYDDRQIVMERLQLVGDRLPPGVQPQLAPISSIMGQIQMIGLWSEGNKTDPLELRTLADWVVRQRLLTIPGVSQVFVMGGGRKQFQVLVDPDALLKYDVTLDEVKQAVARSNRNAVGGYLDQQGADELLVRTLGRVHEVEDLEKLIVKMRHGRHVQLRHVATILEGPQVKRGDSAAFTWVGRQGPARIENGENFTTDTSQSRRTGNTRTVESAGGGPAVVLTVNKQPDADTRLVSENIETALAEIQKSLPRDVRIAQALYSQKSFIDRAIDNVVEALADGGVLVVVILLLFLLNFRTTFITLTAIPLSIVLTAFIFAGFGLSINTMTLGGLAVAIGELVDDAIVDVENIFRRLRENRRKENPKNPLLVVFQASVEIRNSIVFGTIIVVLVFVPLFALSGMEGRLFTPLGIAYIVSILSSLLVSLTLTPVLSYWLLAEKRIWPFLSPVLAFGIAAAVFYWVLPRLAEILSRPWLTAGHPMYWSLLATPVIWVLILLSDRIGAHGEEGRLLSSLKWIAGKAINFSLRWPKTVLAGGGAAVLVAFLALNQLERDFLPPFNEGAVQLNVILPPGTSLSTSNEIAGQVDRRLTQVPDIVSIVRRTGRAEQDEHAMGVNASEIIVETDAESQRGREEILTEIREAVDDVPGIVTSVEQPIAHLISHMLSGVKAQVAIKLFGDELDVLRRNAERMKTAIQNVPGVTDLMVEPQVVIPQLRIELDRDQLALHGLKPEDVNELVQTAMQGEVVSLVLEGQRTFDLLVRLEEQYREDVDKLRRLAINLPEGGTIPLESVAAVYRSGGPNTINREQVRRRIVLQCNVTERGLVDVVEDIQARLEPIVASLPPGYFVEYGGQFESQQSASRIIGMLFLVSLIGIFLVLFTMFRSANFSLQVMAALPMAFIGSVAALVLTGQTLTIAAMVGFISLGGIASRNGILLLNHYIHLVRYEGERWTSAMIVRAGQERLAPVLMTALTSGIGLVPLAMAAGEPGKEILYPVATVIIGGLISSTLLEFLLRPALFWSVGRNSGERIVSTARREVALIEESEEETIEHLHGGEHREHEAVGSAKTIV